jgi:hypothetical protein
MEYMWTQVGNNSLHNTVLQILWHVKEADRWDVTYVERKLPCYTTKILSLLYIYSSCLPQVREKGKHSLLHFYKDKIFILQ